MSSIGSGDRRSVIPRWRTSTSFASSAESSALKAKDSPVAFVGSFDRIHDEWQRNRTAGYLADAFSTAIVEGRKEFLPLLAAEVLRLGDKIPAVLQSLAKDAVDGHSPQIVTPELDVKVEAEVVGRYVTQLKKRAASYPRNGFVWHDLSYMYNLLGEHEKAQRAMAVALKVSGAHRLIARGASRLYMHQADPEMALSVLKRAQAFASDPWLLSAHMAVAQAIGEESAQISTARRLYEQLGAGLRSSELGMAIATHEFMTGRAKKAKAMAREAAFEPTENALAQGVWLSPRLNTNLVSENAVASADLAFEARSWEAYYKGDWRESARHALDWLAYEPFSMVPALHGSFVAATFLYDYELSRKISEFGLRANPGSWSLKNNLVVALASLDRIAEAQDEFVRMQIPDSGTHDYAVWAATSGLLLYRAGEHDAARKQYELSREYLERSRDRSGQLVSAVYQSIEEARAGNTDTAAKLVQHVYAKLGIKNSEKGVLDALAEEVIQSKHDRLAVQPAAGAPRLSGPHAPRGT